MLANLFEGTRVGFASALQTKARRLRHGQHGLDFFLGVAAQVLDVAQLAECITHQVVERLLR